MAQPSLSGRISDENPRPCAGGFAVGAEATPEGLGTVPLDLTVPSDTKALTRPPILCYDGLTEEGKLSGENWICYKTFILLRSFAGYKASVLQILPPSL